MRRRGQTALEFLVLTGFMLFVFSAFYYVIQERLAFAQEQQNFNELVAVADTINQEVALANQVSDGYNRTFELPLSANGESYSAALTGKSEVTINTSTYEYLLFLPTNITIASGAEFKAGKNMISKYAGNITVFPLP